jgi:hypothetical protein
LYLFHIGVTQDELLNFSGSRLRKLLDEFPDARDLERGEPGSAKFHEFMFVDRLSGFDLHESDEYLAPVLVRNTDDGYCRNQCVIVEHVLDLAGINVLSAADDHVFLASPDAAIAMLVQAAEILGVEPSVRV